ncbi:MAG: glucosaminidase domain-containing protein [Richelia sp. RM2_1_2]|nr:glucosaminidase domain-containing protein [Richelia sp. RM2_1_2]
MKKPFYDKILSFQRKLILICICLLPITTKAPTIKTDDCLEFKTKQQEVLYYLAAYELDSLWIAVFVTESGWNHDSYIATNYNNIMGMSSHKRPTQSGSYKSYAIYKSVQLAIYDVYLWEQLNPRLDNESFFDYLKRRKYNPREEYYTYLKQINVHKYEQQRFTIYPSE